MRAKGSHIDGVRAALAERLIGVGFCQPRRASFIFRKPLTPDAFAWVGLNTRTQKSAGGEVGLRPKLGVWHEPLMRLYASCLPMLDLRSVPTVATGMADLLGDGAHEWVFAAGCDVGAVADDVVRTIDRVGLPWCVDHAGPLSMREAVVAHRAFGITHTQEQILPLLDVLCGDTEAAAARLRGSLNVRSGRHDIEASEFGEFAGNLLRHIGSLHDRGRPMGA